VAHYYLATARKACLLLNDDAAWRTEAGPRVLESAGRELRDRDDVYAWLDSDGENLLAIARQAIALVDDGTALAAAICSAVGLGWTLRGRHRDKLTLGELVLRNAGRTGDVLHQAIAHDSIGFGLVRCGDHKKAVHHLRQARDGYRRAGAEAGEAVQLAALASAYRLLGQYENSIRHSAEAVKINRRIGRRTALADCLTSLGLTYRRINRPEAEIAAHMEALAVAESLEERNWASNVLCNLAESTRLARQPQQAKRYFEQAQQASLESESTPTFLDAEIWWGLGRTHHDLGNRREAATCWQQSAAIMYELGLITADEKESITAADTPIPPDVIRRNT
jgi:tetratricopeptide (TPR) repeat protein